MSARAQRWWLGILIAGVVLLVLCVVIIRAMAQPPLRPAPEPKQARTSAGDWVEVSRGQYLVRAGDCMACHTADGGKAFAGGRAVPTPFGTIYSTNITPDPATGIGNWSFEDFYRAMHYGIRRDGSRLYPAFPYPWYTKTTRDDVFAIKAWLDTLEPVRQRPPDNELPWPLGMRAVMAGWNTLFFDAGTYQPNPDESAQWNRGAYLVQGLMHCAACHTEKNFAGATNEDRALQGGLAEHAFAPSLHGGMRDGLGSWSVNDIVEYLKTGSNAKTSAAGPMAEVVERSTQYLNDADLTAIAVYLKKLPGDNGNAHDDKDDSDEIADATMQRGHDVYFDNCQGCHMEQGKGLDRVFPPLNGSSAIMTAKPDTLILVLLQGARIPQTDLKPTGFKMPAFDAKLDDEQIADVLTYIRNAWGNRASAVSASEVAEKREVASTAR